MGQYRLHLLWREGQQQLQTQKQRILLATEKPESRVLHNRRIQPVIEYNLVNGKCVQGMGEVVYFLEQLWVFIPFQQVTAGGIEFDPQGTQKGPDGD